jgi:hypothetical protein
MHINVQEPILIFNAKVWIKAIENNSKKPKIETFMNNKKDTSKSILKYTNWSSLHLTNKNRFGIFCILGILVMP